MRAKNLPRISIVTPSYNQGEYVAATVRSVLLQNYPNLEYIFMDGGSKDATLEQVEPYREQFAHFESGPDGGQSAAIAKGFALSTGDIMGYLNSDDLLLPGALNFVADYFARHPDVDFIYGHRCIIDDVNRVVGHWILPKHSDFFMRRWDAIPQESCFWRRRLFEQAGNSDPTYQFAMDYDLFVRYMRVTKFKRVNRFLSAFRVHPASKTSSLYETQGRQEILRVQQQYNINLSCLIVPKLWSDMRSLYIRALSAMYLAKQRFYPGLPPGKGFNIDDVFGGLLIKGKINHE
jgi:glycosyltransferase involved in cell wall biosynthesis